MVTCKSNNGGFGKLEAVNQQELHAIDIVNTTFEFVPSVLIRHATYHGPFVAMRMRWQSEWCVVVRRGRLLVVAGGGRRRGHGKRVGYESYSFAENAADGGCAARRELQRSVAV